MSERYRYEEWRHDTVTGDNVCFIIGVDGNPIEIDRQPPNAPQADARERVSGVVIDVARAKVAALLQIGQPVRDLVNAYPETLDALNNGNWLMARTRIAEAAADGDPPTISAEDRDALLALLDSHGVPDPEESS